MVDYEKFSAFMNTELGKRFFAYEDSGGADRKKREALLEELFRLTPILRKPIPRMENGPRHSDDF